MIYSGDDYGVYFVGNETTSIENKKNLNLKNLNDD